MQKPKFRVFSEKNAYDISFGSIKYLASFISFYYEMQS